MKDYLFLPAIAGLIAQTSGVPQDSWERLGIGGLSIGVTVFVWKYWAGKEKEERIANEAKEQEEKEERKKREASDTAERNRLLEVANKLQAENVALQKQMVELLVTSASKSEAVAQALIQSQKDYARMHEDGQRSIKDLARKIPSSRVVTVGNDAKHPVPVANQPSE